MTTEEKQFDVALSFAGEDRKYVEEVASILRQMGIKVFYDKYELVSFWGKNLYDHLQDIYQNKAKYTIMFISKYYAEKVWTNYERKSAQAKAFVSNKEYILPARFDNTEIPGLLPTIGYVNLIEYSPRQFADLIKQKVGPIKRQNFFPEEVDILYHELKVRSKKAKNEIKILAKNFFEHLKLMTLEERDLIYETINNSCPAGFPENIHLNIQYLSRIIGKSIEEIQAIYSRLDCLGIEARIERSEKVEDQICKEMQIIKVKYNPGLSAFEMDNATFLLIAIIDIFGQHLCPECRKIAFLHLDFSILSKLTGFPEEFE